MERTQELSDGGRLETLSYGHGVVNAFVNWQQQDLPAQGLCKTEPVNLQLEEEMPALSVE